MSIVLITGSAGLIGSEAARHFAKQGFEVVGIDNDMRREFFGDQASTKWQLQELEAIQLCQEIAGRELTYTYHNENRAGDHIWYLSDVSRFQSHYPDWKLTYNVTDILRDIYDSNGERWCEIART